MRRLNKGHILFLYDVVFSNAQTQYIIVVFVMFFPNNSANLMLSIKKSKSKFVDFYDIGSDLFCLDEQQEKHNRPQFQQV